MGTQLIGKGIEMKKSDVQVDMESRLNDAIENMEAVGAKSRALPVGSSPDIREAYSEQWSAYYDEVKSLEKQLDAIAPIYEVGDGITESLWSDAHAYTVIEVSPNGKRMKIQRDDAEATNKEDLKFHVGGFSAHCSNQNVLEYEYKRNLNGGIKEVSLRTQKMKPEYNDGISSRQFWVEKGRSTASCNGRPFFSGRHEKYDYNF